MKKIIFTVTNDLSFDRRMHRICATLSKNNFDVTLVGRKLRNSSDLPATSWKNHRLKCWFIKGKLFYIEFNLRLFLWLLFRKADIICAIDLDTIAPCLWVANIKKIKVGYDAHEYFTEVPELLGRPITKGIWESVARNFIKQMDFCYTVNESLAKVLSDKYGKRFDVIRNVPWLTDEKTENREKDRMIIYQGAVNAGRALEQLIEAVKTLDNIKVLIAGEGDLFGYFKDLIQAQGLQEKVILTGNIKPEELGSYTAKAMAGYNVLEPESLSYYYSLSNKFFDYIHAGIPVITNELPEYKTINDEFEVCCFAGPDPENIRKAIVQLSENAQLYSRLKNNCLQARLKYNWNLEEKKLLEIYNAI